VGSHEVIHSADEIAPGSDRGFGLIVGGILLAIGGYQLFKGASWSLYVGIPGLLLVLIALAVPRLLHPLNIAWTRLGIFLGTIVTPVVMFIVYAIAVVPVGLLLKVSGKDLLRLRRKDDSPSFWVEREPPGPPPESLKDQF
jgi:hypothetical protein